MNDVVARLREHLKAIAPYPKRCIGFDGRPTMNGTAFFPGGDGLWKPKVGDGAEFPFGGTLVLGNLGFLTATGSDREPFVPRDSDLMLII